VGPLAIHDPDRVQRHGPGAHSTGTAGSVIRQQLTVGTLVAFAALLTMLYRPLMQLATMYVTSQGAVAVFERIFDTWTFTPNVARQAQRPAPAAVARPRGPLST